MDITSDGSYVPIERAKAALRVAFDAVNEVPHDHRGEACAEIQSEIAAAYRLLEAIGADELLPVTPLV